MPETPDDLDIVQIIKQEWTALGGGEGADYAYSVPLTAIQDAPEVPGVFFVEAGRRNRAAAIWPHNGDIRFRDFSNPGADGKGFTLTRVLAGTAGDEKAKVSANDTTAGYLNGKLVAGTGIDIVEQNDGGNETLRIDNTGGSSSDELVKVSADDTVAGYLEDKVVAGPGIKLTTLNPGGDEDLKVSSGKVIACSWGTNATAYIYAYSSGAWNVMARLVFPGTDHMQAAVKMIKAILWVGASTRPMDARIYDLTNSQVIAQSNTFTNEDPELIDFGTISNVPTESAVWEIQGHKDSVPAGFIYMSGLTIFFEDN